MVKGWFFTRKVRDMFTSSQWNVPDFVTMLLFLNHFVLQQDEIGLQQHHPPRTITKTIPPGSEKGGTLANEGPP